MTDRDPVPSAPTCPVCSSHEKVERDRLKGWLCGGCWTVFSGGQDEWDRTRYMREHYAKQDSARQRQEADA